MEEKGGTVSSPLDDTAHTAASMVTTATSASAVTKPTSNVSRTGGTDENDAGPSATSGEGKGGGGIPAADKTVSSDSAEGGRSTGVRSPIVHKPPPAFGTRKKVDAAIEPNDSSEGRQPSGVSNPISHQQSAGRPSTPQKDDATIERKSGSDGGQAAVHSPLIVHRSPVHQYQSPANRNAVYRKQPTPNCAIPNCPNRGGPCVEHGKMVRICRVRECDDFVLPGAKGGLCAKHAGSPPPLGDSAAPSASTERPPFEEGAADKVAVLDPRENGTVQDESRQTNDAISQPAPAPGGGKRKSSEAVESPATFRTVMIPEGVLPGDVFHVLLGEEGKTMGVVCPKGVQAGDKLLILEPGTLEPPIQPETIARMNEEKFTNGILTDPSVPLNDATRRIAVDTFWKKLWPNLRIDGWTYWRRVHYDFGALAFFPPRTRAVDDLSNLVRNEHYFDTAKDIINFMSKKSSYTTLIRDFHTEVTAKIRKMARQEQGEKDATRKRRVAVQQVSEIDAWKYVAEREHIQIGSQAQVRSLPRAGTHVAGEGEEDYM